MIPFQEHQARVVRKSQKNCKENASTRHRSGPSKQPKPHRRTSVGLGNKKTFPEPGCVNTIAEGRRSIPTTPAPLNPANWAEPPATNFRVRGPSYLTDKVKVQSQPPAFRLLTVDLVQSDRPLMGGICSDPNERIQQALQREMATGQRELPDFVFAMNIAVPGPPFHHLVSYFAVDDLANLLSSGTPFSRLAAKFFFGEDDSFRDAHFKLIPRCVEGNFVVKKAVGGKPAILGKKLPQKYIRTDRFMELIVDVGAEKMARSIVKLAIGYAKNLVVDMGFVLEANDESSLPEQLMGCVRIKNLDLKRRSRLATCEDPNSV